MSQYAREHPEYYDPTSPRYGWGYARFDRPSEFDRPYEDDRTNQDTCFNCSGKTEQMHKYVIGHKYVPLCHTCYGQQTEDNDEFVEDEE